MDTPWDSYEPLRKQAPLYYSEEARAWFLSRHQDVLHYIKDKRLQPNWEKVPVVAIPPEQHDEFRLVTNTASQFFINWDSERHREIRKRLNPDYSPKAQRHSRIMVERIEFHCRKLLDACKARGELEAWQDFSTPLAFTIICEILGFPFEEEQSLLPKWAEDVILAFNFPSADQLHRSQKSLQELGGFVREVVAEKRKNLGGDMTSTFIEAENDGILNEDELVSQISFVILSGNQTVATQIVANLRYLLDNPALYRELRSDPDLIPVAVEEFLRYVSHLAFVPRFASEDMEILGQTVSKGEMVLLGLGSANFDPEVFDKPEVLDIHRNPNPHLSFGHGPHICAGMQLARHQMQISMRMMLETLPNLRLKEPPPDWITAPNGFRRLPHLRLCFDPA